MPSPSDNQANRMRAATEGEARYRLFRAGIRPGPRTSMQRPSVSSWPDDPIANPDESDSMYFYRPNELLVRPIDDTTVGRVREVLYDLGVLTELLTGAEPGEVGLLRIRSQNDPRMSVSRLLAHLAEASFGLDTVGPNHVFFLAAPFVLSATPWFSGGGDDLPAEVGRDEPPTTPSNDPTRGANIEIAVFDSGLLDHYRDLTSPTSPGGDWLANVHGDLNYDRQLDLYDNHGLFVAGIIGYSAPSATVYVRHTLQDDEAGPKVGTVDDLALAAAINNALAGRRPVPLVNLSLGGQTAGGAPPLATTKAINDHSGTIFVASAGNTGPGSKEFYPASLPQVIGVGALDAGGQPAWFSNDHPSAAKVWARGVNVVSAFRCGELEVAEQQRHYETGRASWCGTSFAAPIVTAALCDYLAQTNGPPNSRDALQWLTQRSLVAGRVVVT